MTHSRCVSPSNPFVDECRLPLSDQLWPRDARGRRTCLEEHFATNSQTQTETIKGDTPRQTNSAEVVQGNLQAIHRSSNIAQRLGRDKRM